MKLYAAPLNFRALAQEFDVPTDFPQEVTAEAQRLKFSPEHKRIDARGIPLVTIDPPGSKDLDQALCIEARGPHRPGAGCCLLYTSDAADEQ